MVGNTSQTKHVSATGNVSVSSVEKLILIICFVGIGKPHMNLRKSTKLAASWPWFNCIYFLVKLALLLVASPPKSVCFYQQCRLFIQLLIVIVIMNGRYLLVNHYIEMEVSEQHSIINFYLYKYFIVNFEVLL